MSDSSTRQLEDIKRLLMLLLLKLDTTSEEIGMALNIDSSAVRRSMPTKRIKKILQKGNI